MTHGCVICGKGTSDRSFTDCHWLCRSHRRKSARAIFQNRSTVSEVELVQSLAFTFPMHCDVKEFALRLGYASNIWLTTDKVQAICSAHNLRDLTIVRGLDRMGVMTMIERIVAFMCRNVRRHECLHDYTPVLHQRVRDWYPKFVKSGTRAFMMRTEQMIRELHRATGGWEFMVLSTLSVTLGQKLPAEIVEHIYASYVDMIAIPSANLAGFSLM